MVHIRGWIYACMLPACLWVHDAAQAASELTEQEFLSEIPMVLTASRLRQPLSDVPVTMTVIDRATIEASGLRTIADLFRLVPGMYVGHGHGIEGVVPVVSYHGLTDEFSRRMQVLIDGRSVYTPLFGTVLWDDLPITVDDIERIEICRGPNAASYGANAFFGAINIITRVPLAGDRNLAQVRTGQAGVKDDVLRASVSDGPLRYRLTFNHKEDDGFVNVYDQQRHNLLTGRGEYEFSEHDLLEVQGGFSDGVRNQGFYTSISDRPRTKTIDDEYLQAKWQHAASPVDEQSLRYDFQRHAYQEWDYTLPISLPGAPLQTYFIQGSVHFDRHEIEYQRTLEPLSDVRIVWGTAARLDQVYAPIYFGGQHEEASNLERVFAHAEWRVSRQVLLQAGGMLERTSIDGLDVSPRGSINYEPAQGQTLRASVSKGSRTPLLYEEHANYGLDLGRFRDQLDLATGGVHSERLVNAEVGYHGEFSQATRTVDVKIYRDVASDLIGNIDTQNASSFRGFTSDPQNIGGARVKGIETEIHLQLLPDTNLLLTHAFTTIDSPISGLEQSMPRHLVSALLRQQFVQGFEASAAYYFSDALTPGGGQGSVRAARRLDARVARSWRPAGVPVRAVVGVQDAISPYQDFRPDNIFTRRYYVEISASP
jgi:iron complex outermembrane recepter protein